MEEKDDDDERGHLLQNILDLLLAGGYFRARISSLSPFDKLTGGLAWCITASNADVDYDLFYDDDAALGIKIKVGEAIEESLQKMGCPYPLQTHQIQGLDYPSILPVVQWLVKRVLTTREESSTQLRRVSLKHFEDNYKLPEEGALQESITEESKKFRQISVLDRPQRVYRRLKNFPISKDRAERLHTTLLEYGHQGARYLAQPIHDDQSKLEQGCPLNEVIYDDDKVGQSSLVLKAPEIENSLSSFTISRDGQLLGSNVKCIVQLRSEEIQAGVLKYSQNGEIRGTDERQVSAVVKQIERQETGITRLQQNIARSLLTTESLKATITKEDEQRKEMELEVEKLQGLLNENNIAQQFFSLLKQLEILETEEMHLQEEYTKRRAEMEAHKQQLQEQLAPSKDVEKLSEIDNGFVYELQKWKTLRTDLATKNRALLLRQRQLDDVPSQTELIQYQACFIDCI